ncbi:unnamed protein product [Camellia sinensis]
MHGSSLRKHGLLGLLQVVASAWVCTAPGMNRSKMINKHLLLKMMFMTLFSEADESGGVTTLFLLVL